MTQVFAFDIDGALTEQEGITKFRTLMEREDVRVGIVSARTEENANEFIQENNLKPDFVKTGVLKGRLLGEVADEGVYVGSWARDRFHAKMAGWDYTQI